MGTEGVDHPGAHIVDRQEGRDGRIGLREFFEDAHGVESTQFAASDIVTAVNGRHAQLGRLAQYVGGEVVVLVPFQCVWRDALFGERGSRLGDHAFVVVQAE